ncbi:MAG TPA: shikimate kinase [Bacteroidales bacterium]|nr:shikimate kinase [Bacteroidales bacterium]
MLKNQIVYIIGFMGCGKSTAGRKLASHLGWSFIDLDKKIEKYSGKTISELFSEYGETYFRNIESEVLRSFKSLTNTVISTGGGTPCHDTNMDYMLESGLTIYLKLTANQLKNRLAESKGKRPLIKGLGSAELLSFIEEKLAFREKWYNRAEIIIEAISLDISILHNIVKSRLNA